MRVLAVDHGEARAGCAVCDPTETIVRPVGVVEPADPRRVAAIAAEQSAELIVVGLPVSLDGSEGAQARAARGFAENVAGHSGLRVSTHDERLTTRMAEDSARHGAVAEPDALAACHLLESFLGVRRREAEVAR